MSTMMHERLDRHQSSVTKGDLVRLAARPHPEFIEHGHASVRGAIGMVTEVLPGDHLTLTRVWLQVGMVRVSVHAPGTPDAQEMGYWELLT